MKIRIRNFVFLSILLFISGINTIMGDEVILKKFEFPDHTGMNAFISSEFSQTVDGSIEIVRLKIDNYEPYSYTCEGRIMGRKESDASQVVLKQGTFDVYPLSEDNLLLETEPLYANSGTYHRTSAIDDEIGCINNHKIVSDSNNKNRGRFDNAVELGAVKVTDPVTLEIMSSFIGFNFFINKFDLHLDLENGGHERRDPLKIEVWVSKEDPKDGRKWLETAKQLYAEDIAGFPSKEQGFNLREFSNQDKYINFRPSEEGYYYTVILITEKTGSCLENGKTYVFCNTIDWVSDRRYWPKFNSILEPIDNVRYQINWESKTVSINFDRIANNTTIPNDKFTIALWASNERPESNNTGEYKIAEINSKDHLNSYGYGAKNLKYTIPIEHLPPKGEYFISVSVSAKSNYCPDKSECVVGKRTFEHKREIYPKGYMDEIPVLLEDIRENIKEDIVSNPLEQSLSKSTGGGSINPFLPFMILIYQAYIRYQRKITPRNLIYSFLSQWV